MLGNLGSMNVLITATDQASGEIDQVQGKMRSASETARTLGTGLAAAGAVGVAAAGKSVQQFSKFEDQMIEVQKVTGMSDKRMKSMSGTIRDMAAGPLPASATELGKIAAQAGSVGIRGEKNIANFTESVQKMATATRLSSQEAAEQIAKISNAFEVPMSQAENLGSSINALSNSTASWADEISQGVRRAAGAASNLGISAQETSGIIATLVDQGMNARRAGTRMRRVFTQMSTKASEMADVMGVSTGEMRKSIEEDALGTLKRFMRQAKDTGNASAIFSETFGSAGKAALDMISDVDSLNKNLETSRKAFKENTSLQEEYENALGGLQTQFQNTQQKVKEMALSFGSSLAPILKQDVLPAVNSMLDYFNNLDKNTKGLIATIMGLGGIMAIVTGGAMVLGTVIAGISAPVLALGAAVAGIIGFFVMFKKNIWGIKDALVGMFNTAKPLINGLLGAFQTMVSYWIKDTGRLVKAIGVGVEKIVSPIMNFLMPVIKNLGTVFILTMHLIGQAVKSGRELIGKFATGVIDLFKGLVQGLIDAVNAGLDVVVDFINGLIDKANAASKALGQGKIAGKLEDITVSEALGSVGGAVQDKRDQMDTLRLDIAEQVGGESARNQVKAFQNMVETGVGNIDDMGRAIQGAGDKIIETGEEIGNKDISVSSIESALGGKSGKKGVKAQKKQAKELKKMRKQFEKQNKKNDGEGKTEVKIRGMTIKANDPEEFEKKLRKEASASGIYQ